MCYFQRNGDFMKTNLVSLKDSTLFANISILDLQKLCICLSAHEKIYPKDSFIFRAGDPVRSVYLIISGNLHIIDEDFWGNRSIIETMNKNILFGEAYVFSSRQTQLVSVIAAQDSVILEMDPMRLFEDCSNSCSCHTQLIRNTLEIVSEKIVRLTEKLGHVSMRTTREKLFSYLSKCARYAKSNSFDIPYSRQQLADYLCVDRSALSHELSKMQMDGLIRYRKNHFELLRDEI